MRLSGPSNGQPLQNYGDQNNKEDNHHWRYLGKKLCAKVSKFIQNRIRAGIFSRKKSAFVIEAMNAVKRPNAGTSRNTPTRYANHFLHIFVLLCLPRLYQTMSRRGRSREKLFGRPEICSPATAAFACSVETSQMPRFFRHLPPGQYYLWVHFRH